jgi:hypothetical protein
MVDTFGELYKQNIDKISQKVADLKILILGAYRPRDMFKRLEGIRDCLRQKGFINTYLVENLRDEPRFDKDNDIHWTWKSNYLMENSDLNLFIFFEDCDNSGVGSELSYFINKTEEDFRCLVLCEGSIEQISSRIRADIKEMKLRNINFKAGDDLNACNLAYGFINTILMKEKNRIYKNSLFFKSAIPYSDSA